MSLPFLPFPLETFRTPPEQLTLYLCPLLRYTRAVARSLTEDFRRAACPCDREKILDNCLTVGKLLLNVIIPLARQTDPDRAAEYERLAQSLLRLAGPRWEVSDANFPSEDLRRTFLDRLAQLEDRLIAIQRQTSRKEPNGQ